MDLENVMGLDWLVAFMLWNDRKSNRYTCELQRFRNWCRPKARTFSWFSPKENHSSRSLSGHGNCETALLMVAAVFCMAGCSQGPAASASQPVLASVSSKAEPTPSAVAEVPARLPASAATGEGREYTTVGPLVVEQQADVVAERDGRVTVVKVEIGDHVRRGEVLAMLDDRALEAAQAEKAARLASLRAQVQTWEAEQKSNEADLRRADAMRAEKILDDEDWEHVQYKLTETRTQVTRYRAEVAAAEAELRVAEVELDQSHIVAPFDGLVGRRSVHDAQQVKKGDALFWITAQAPLRIIFTVPESAMASFPRGAKLELTTTDYPHLKQAASVYRVSPVVDPASGSIEVLGNVEKPSPLLKPGMSMQVKLSPR
jgi:RND family efflux transporter MFP subunit